MHGADWQKVREIFDSALGRAPKERHEFVNEACGANTALRAEVESLLASHDNAESFMETPAVAKVADVIEGKWPKLEPGTCFGAALLDGDVTKARSAYQDFFALWKDADADIPILIEAKQEYEKLN